MNTNTVHSSPGVGGSFNTMPGTSTNRAEKKQQKMGAQHKKIFIGAIFNPNPVETGGNELKNNRAIKRPTQLQPTMALTRIEEIHTGAEINQGKAKNKGRCTFFKMKIKEVFLKYSA